MRDMLSRIPVWTMNLSPQTVFFRALYGGVQGGINALFHGDSLINGFISGAISGGIFGALIKNLLLWSIVHSVFDYCSGGNGGNGGGDDGDDGDDNGPYKPGDKTPKGRVFTEHGARQANERGFSAEAIDSIIDNNWKKRVKEIDTDSDIGFMVRWRFQDKRGNTVITSENVQRIISVYSYPFEKNYGDYIPKGFFW